MNFTGVSHYVTLRKSPIASRKNSESSQEKSVEEKKEIQEEKKNPEKKESLTKENENKKTTPEKKEKPENIEKPEKVEKVEPKRPPLPQKPKPITKIEKLKNIGSIELNEKSPSERTSEKRVDILKELVEFEKDFVQIMSNFDKSFVNPIMRIKNQLKQSSIFFTILPKIEVIFGVHDTFLSNIEQSLSSFSPQTSLSASFKTMVKNKFFIC